jgi:hypothetical protein
MKFLLFLLLSFNIVSAYEVNLSPKTQKILTKRYKKELNNLTINQIRVLLKTYDKAKHFDLELTLCAIAWQESYFGKYKINLADPSFGVFHANINTVIKKHNYKNTKWRQSRLAEALINDYDFAFSEALNELEYWKSYWKQKEVKDLWIHFVRSYNTGFAWTENEHYIDEIVLKIRVLKVYFKKNKVYFDKLGKGKK